MGRALLVGLAADALLADPARGHPVAGYGSVAAAVERAMWRPDRRVGATYAAGMVGLPVLATAVVRRRFARRAAIPFSAALAWGVLGSSSLWREAVRVRDSLATGNLDEARRRLPALCGRDPNSLDEAGLVRAVIESVAENTSDAAVAPLLWGALAGPAGLVGYRAVNTLDAMVGHRSERYEEFGWAAARTDDAANVLPARLTALLAAVLAPLVGGRPADAWRAWQRDAADHPSPNAGPCEAAFAGALGVRLGGAVRYPYGASARPHLGDGPDPRVGDIDRAIRLSRAVVVTAALLCARAAAR